MSQVPGVKEVQDRTRVGEERSEGIVIYSAPGGNIMPLIVRSLDTANIGIDDLVITKPSLDDVFIKFTGKQLRTDLQKVPPKAGFRSRRR